MKPALAALCCFILSCALFNQNVGSLDIFSTRAVLKTSKLEKDGWRMIFLARSGNGRNVFDAWDLGLGSTKVKPKKFLHSRGAHYRDNSIICDWVNRHISEVKFALYDQQREVAHVIFNGKGSNANNWFESKRVESSSYSDLKFGSFNYFNIAGDVRRDLVERRFFINRSFGGCGKDTGYMVVLDTKTHPAKSCPWERDTTYPQFLYSKYKGANAWSKKEFGKADFLAIFIKT